jgi:hypothetical protein
MRVLGIMMLCRTYKFADVGDRTASIRSAVAVLNPAFAAAMAGVSVWRERIYSLI